MNQRIRQFVIGLLALGMLLGVYWLYTRFGNAPSVVTDIAKALPESVVEDRAAGAPGEIGTIGGVGVRRVRNTQFTHRNEHNQVDREFGFEDLLHEEGDQWEITDPYMKLFFPAFRCHVTADRGKVQVETAFGRPMANDALFSGNVVIHIIPSEPDNPWECFIHLDDVEFLAARSLFSSSGAVQFLSRSAQLTGTGMELVYDEARTRLELFRIFDLDSLRLRSSEFSELAGLSVQNPPAAAPLSSDAETPSPVPTAVDSGVPTPDLYQCVFRRNVVIETPDRVVRAGDVLAVNRIPWARSKTSDPTAVSESNGSTRLPAPEPKALDTTASSHLAMTAIPADSFDIVVTCDGGFSITPEGAATASVASADVAAPEEMPALPPDRQYTTARRIDVDATTNDATLAGPVEMLAYIDPNGLTGETAGGALVPMTVTARQAVQYRAATNQVVLEGDPTVVVQKSDPNFQEEYTLKAPRLTLDLVPEPNATNELRIRQFVADGGPVVLRVVRKDGERVLGWTRLEASRLQYGTDANEFTALGPGLLWMHNAEATKPQSEPNDLSLDQPCYARLSNFDLLKYSASENRLIAEDDARQLVLDYAPQTDGAYDHHVRVVVGHVEASLQRIAAGRTELVSLTASRGIEYVDDTNQFAGSVLVYDRSRDLVTVRGDEILPCYLNGVLVDEIEMSVKTGRIKTPITAPSILQVQP
jgi:hypothetical protein